MSNKEQEFFTALQYNLQNAMSDAANKNVELAEGIDVTVADLAYHVGSSFASVLFNMVDNDVASFTDINERIIEALLLGYQDKARLLETDSENLIKFEGVPAGTTFN